MNCVIMAQATLQLCPRAGPNRKVFLEQEEEAGEMAGVRQCLHGYKSHVEALPPGTLIIGALPAHHPQPTQRPLRDAGSRRLRSCHLLVSTAVLEGPCRAGP